MENSLWLRCPMCEILYCAEIDDEEIEDRLEECKTFILDICPHCQAFGKKLFIRRFTLIDAGLING